MKQFIAAFLAAAIPLSSLAAVNTPAPLLPPPPPHQAQGVFLKPNGGSAGNAALPFRSDADFVTS